MSGDGMRELDQPIQHDIACLIEDRECNATVQYVPGMHEEYIHSMAAHTMRIWARSCPG